MLQYRMYIGKTSIIVMLICLPPKPVFILLEAEAPTVNMTSVQQLERILCYHELIIVPAQKNSTRKHHTQRPPSMTT
jgi:hypothetical protein